MLSRAKNCSVYTLCRVRVRQLNTCPPAASSDTRELVVAYCCVLSVSSRPSSLDLRIVSTVSVTFLKEGDYSCSLLSRSTACLSTLPTFYPPICHWLHMT